MFSAAPKRPIEPRRWVLWVWLIFGVAMTVRTQVSPNGHTVFPVFATGAAHWWQDAPLYADYRPDLHLDFFRYPPALAIAFTPLSLLGNRAGGIVWAWLNLSVYFLGLWRLRRDVLPNDWSERREAAYYLLALAGALAGLWNGQSNALLTGLLLCGLSAAVRERWWSAAVLLATPVLFKLTPLPLVALFCALWPRPLTGRLLVVVGLGLALPFLTRPPSIVLDQYGGFLAQLAEQANKRWPGFRDGWTLWVVLRDLAAGGRGWPDLEASIDGAWYRFVQAGAGLAVLAVCMGLKRRGVPNRELTLLTLALGSGWLLFLGPAAEHPTFAFLAPALAWSLVQPRLPAPRLAQTAGVLILICGWGNFALWQALPVKLVALPLGTLCFFVWAAWATYRRLLPFAVAASSEIRAGDAPRFAQARALAGQAGVNAA